MANCYERGACTFISSETTRTAARALGPTVRDPWPTCFTRTDWFRRRYSFYRPGQFVNLSTTKCTNVNSTTTVNPYSKTHGAPEDEERHVGDLGNVQTDGQGNAKGSITDKHVKLFGQDSILGVSSNPSTYPKPTLVFSPCLKSANQLLKTLPNLAHHRHPRWHRRSRQGRQRGQQEDGKCRSPSRLRRYWYRSVDSRW